MRSSILIALALLTGMSSVWAKNNSYTLKPHGHSGTATVKQRAHGPVSASKRSPSAKEIDDAARDADQQRLLNEQWQREQSN